MQSTCFSTAAAICLQKWVSLPAAVPPHAARQRAFDYNELSKLSKVSGQNSCACSATGLELLHHRLSHSIISNGQPQRATMAICAAITLEQRKQRAVERGPITA